MERPTSEPICRGRWQWQIVVEGKAHNRAVFITQRSTSASRILSMDVEPRVRVGSLQLFSVKSVLREISSQKWIEARSVSLAKP